MLHRGTLRGMCTVVLRVPEPGRGDVRILALRDEDPDRPWRPLGAWWPERPGVRGVLDELAGGAWLAHDDRRLAVLLNRAGGSTAAVPASRGSLVLDSVAGRPLPDPLTTLGFNLVAVDATSVVVTSWESGQPRRVTLTPGTHMIAHDDVDDPHTARVAAWLDAFAATPTEGDTWWEGGSTCSRPPPRSATSTTGRSCGTTARTGSRRRPCWCASRASVQTAQPPRW
ncbi:NRDE family protein [Tessaracoccus coleopterorum]|uniref:NRDE family protein n=1 Tax=Tessaracoccus coleopterorum TaxID=2714950 RepID=UPI0018D3C112|nr:NRDE family protein [Tessaracoccus coleopterorum]